MPEIKEFIRNLQEYHGKLVFNPWKDYDRNYDIGSDAPQIRRSHLEAFLRLRIPHARYILVAEALGYQGGHFSGIAMTSERILLDHHPAVCADVVIGRQGKRTSKVGGWLTKKVQDKGFAEPTATIVWQTLLDNKITPQDIMLWNIFPFHPHEPEDLLSNRTPTADELEKGLDYTPKMQNLCPKAKIIAIGKKAYETLAKAKIETSYLRHPANGGAQEFRDGIKGLNNLN